MLAGVVLRLVSGGPATPAPLHAEGFSWDEALLFGFVAVIVIGAGVLIFGRGGEVEEETSD